MTEKTSKPVYIISDEPEKSSDLFGFDAYAKTLAELIANKDNKTPLVIGVYGSWGSGKTTGVTLYPDGVSCYGCYDMVGNVWEWTNSRYEEKDIHVLCGGSWGSMATNCRCYIRDMYNPGNRYYDYCRTWMTRILTDKNKRALTAKAAKDAKNAEQELTWYRLILARR